MQSQIFIILFLSSICILLYTYYLNIDDSNCKIKHIEVSKKIPKILHCTHYNKDIIPQKVWNNISKYAGDYEFRYYSDDDCIRYLDKNFGKKYSDKFKELKNGAHKADLFRYCVLYLEGGVYMDIDMEPQQYFNKIFDHNAENRFYTVLGSYEENENEFEKNYRRYLNAGNGHIFQALIATYPMNKLFLELTEDFFTIPEPELNYNVFTYKFYDRLRDKVGKPLKIGKNIYSPNNEVILYGEYHLEDLSDNLQPDRYGGLFHVVDENENIISRSRYPDYPWK